MLNRKGSARHRADYALRVLCPELLLPSVLSAQFPRENPVEILDTEGQRLASSAKPLNMSFEVVRDLSVNSSPQEGPDLVRSDHYSVAMLVNASHAARCVACHGVPSHPVPVALVGSLLVVVFDEEESTGSITPSSREDWTKGSELLKPFEGLELLKCLKRFGWW